MTTKEAESIGKLVAGLVLFGSAGCFILGYGFQAFVFCLLAGFGSFGAGYVIWRADKEHNLVRILFPITSASGSMRGSSRCSPSPASSMAVDRLAVAPRRLGME